MAGPPQSRLLIHGNSPQTTGEGGNEVLFVLLGLGAGCGLLLLSILGIIAIAMLPFFLGNADIAEDTGATMSLEATEQDRLNLPSSDR